ncbi:amino acid adenylation domain-containing protein [Plantactinospora solaniradicis]|uniref:Amino acid adenylation domain-containing protein n=1 Tax=Plantactinospora solaniradicis TaxID=1723736 RepID=A0ABW1KIG5_9ACTN
MTSALARRWRADPIAPAIVACTDGSAPPLSYAQERMWFLEQYAPGTATYHMWLSLRVAGPLDPGALRAALDALVARHESLRMRFSATEDGQPKMEVTPPGRVELRSVDVSGTADPVAAARTALTQAVAVPFDLAAGPLFRATLATIGPDDHVLCLTMHHIISDGWSTEVILRELGILYDAHRTGRPAGLPDLPIGYADWARWQRLLGGAERDLSFWRERLADVPALELPTDRPYPPTQTSAGAMHTFRLDAGLTAALGAVGQPRGATPFMVLLAGFQALLGWYTGQDDFAVGVPVAGRGQPQTEGLVGLFVNTIVFRADLAGDPTFDDLLGRLRETAIDAFAHQELPFERLVTELRVRRDVRRPPVFQVSFAMQNYTGAPATRFGNLTVAPFDVAPTTTRHELALYLYHDGDELVGTVTYNTDLFDAATVVRLFDRFAILLHQVAADPAAPLSTLDLLSSREHEVLRRFSAPAPTDSPAAVLTDAFDSWVARTPDAPAVVHGDASLTYAELDSLANGLARRLRECGVGPDARVGICLEQSTDSAVAVLGVLKAGGAYLPLDPEQPPARLAYLLADSDAEVLLTSPDLTGLFEGYPGRLLTDVAAGGSGPLPPIAGPDDLAYVIYTSGSTGQPKGVAVQHRQLVRYLDGMRERLDVVPGSRFGLLQSLSFDFAVTMFYLALATGGRVALIPRRGTAQEVADQVSSGRIDYLKLTPSHLAALAAEVPAASLLPRRALVLGGEASRADWTRELAGLSPAAVVNHYGPTEATVGVTTYQVSPAVDPGSVTTPIGRPLPHAQVHVLDRLLRPVPVGAVGELHLGGDRLARGYLGRPELTAERFVRSASYGRLYRTGDLARWLPSGDLEFLGRRDHQVKLRGYRIELGEIEATLAALPEVTQAAVAVHADRLVAYLERASARELPLAELRQRLALTLPEYMLPAQAVWLDALPRMAHGKIDRGALPAPDVGSRNAFIPPTGPVEEAIAEVWRAVLGVERVGAEDDFFDLGGHSLLAITVVSRLRGLLPTPVTAMDLFKHPTVRGLAGLGDRTGPRPLLHELTRPGPTRTLSLVCVPYGGASAIVYQPLADALPEGVTLYSVAVPGHDLGVAEEARPLDEVAAAVTDEVLHRVPGPLVLYGHCGPGAALTVEVARRLEAAGRTLEAVYLGGVFPFARPRLAGLARFDRLRSDTVYANWLQSMGADVGALEPAERRHLIRAMRRDAEEAEEYFTALMGGRVTPLRAPIVSVVGEKDPGTDYYQERYREWEFLSPRTGLVVLDEAGHYFLKYRAAELAGIVTGPVPASDPGAPPTPGPRPSMGRFLAVAAAQTVSMTGTALTEFALPIWAYLATGSLLRFALFAVAGVLPGILVAPIAGALVDRSDRRRALIGASILAGLIQGALALLLAFDALGAGLLYGLLAALSVALTLQRLAYASAVPQLVPKRYLGHANGVVQLATGAAQFLVPLVAVAMLHSLGMLGILLFDVASYLLCVAVLLAVRFPRTMAWQRRETVLAEIRGGFHYFFRRPGLRAMLLFFVGLNAPLAAVLVLVSPLVLVVGSTADAARVAMVSAAGAVAGGLVLALWGGPKRHRMRGLLWAAAGVAASAAVAGLRPSLALIAVGTFCLSFALVLVNGAWITIIHTKVPQRFHARVIALNQMVALSVLSLGYAVAPLVSTALQPLVDPGGPLAGTVGAVIGVGAGRGTGLLYLLCGLAMGALVVVSLRLPVLAHFDRDVPDAEPDDLVGLAALADRRPPA